jgi:hypothetical protein
MADGGRGLEGGRARCVRRVRPDYEMCSRVEGDYRAAADKRTRPCFLLPGRAGPFNIIISGLEDE